jgi:hypothetical protein
MTTPPPRPASSGGAPAGMPSRLWEAAKHGDRGTIPPWVQAAPDAGTTAPPQISQAARRAAQFAAVAGAIGGGIGIGMGVGISAAEPSRAADLAHSSGAPAMDHISLEHISTDHVTGSVSGDAPGPPGSASEGVTLHTSGEGDHVLHTTFHIPGHAGTGEHEPHGAVVEHDGLTIEIYQDVEVSQGADGTYSVDAVEYVVVRDEHGHDYVFSDNYHTVVPDPPGQESDLVIHETDHVQVTEHPDGSFSVAHPDNSISVTVGADGDGSNQVTVTQSETVQIDHDHPDASADGHDTSSLTEIEDGATTSSQTEVVAADAPLPPGQVSADPQPSGVFVGLHGGPAGPGSGTAQAGHFPGGPVSAPHQGSGGSIDSAPGSTVPNPFQHPAPDPPAGASSPDQHQGTALASHDQPGHDQPGHDQPGLDQPGLDESGAHPAADPVAADPTVPDPSADAHSAGSYEDAHSAGSYEEAGAAHPDSHTASADLPEHDPGTTVLH